MVADETTVHKLIPFRLKSPAATIFGWWLEDSKILLKESKKCSKTSWKVAYSKMLGGKPDYYQR